MEVWALLPTLTSHNGTTNATKENRVHKPTYTDLDQSLAENPPWSGLTCLEETHAHPCD